MRTRALIVFFLGLQTALAASPTNFFEVPPAQFKQSAAREIQIDNVDQSLLAAAILRETNERRRERRLPALKHERRAAEAARIQSEIMRKRGSISHDNPEIARYRTLQQRVQSVGLDYSLIAENVATAFAIRYESGKPVYTERKNGRVTFRYKPKAPPIAPHTYATFAKALVDAWMNSKGHRENILLRDAEYLGSHCAPAVSKGTEMPIFYCAQVFFTPMKQAR